MPLRPFRQVDVFGSAGYDGNPLAVVHDAEGLQPIEMQRFASWTGLSETTFLLPPNRPDADYRVRIFTPREELPFAGHPTLGSAHAWLEAGGEPRTLGDIRQECAAGLIPVRPDGMRLAFAAPPLTRFEPVEEDLLERIATGLGLKRAEVLDAYWLVNGPRWIGVRLASAEQVLAVQADAAALAGLEIGLVGPHPPGADANFEVRALLPGQSVVEDPVTGSLNAGLAFWLIGNGVAPAHYVAAQGTALGRAGRVQVDLKDGTIWIGGRVVTAITGSVDL
jgi:PhzF family phenazine biosynthesis protein